VTKNDDSDLPITAPLAVVGLPLQPATLSPQSSNTPPEWRESVKLLIAALLALGCWGLLGWMFFAQVQYSYTVSDNLRKPENKDQIVVIKDARDGVNQTASSIYAILTPIAASITGYFFVASGSGKVLERKSTQDVLPATEVKVSGS
jgi:hypothetical protein